MPTDAEDLAVAEALAAEWAEINAAPSLGFGEVCEIVARHQRAKRWAVGTAYSFGELMLPSDRNGYVYSVVQPGTSQATALSYTDFPVSLGSVFGDGSSSPQLQWEVAGSDWILGYSVNPAQVNVYDIISATRECWQKKARLATQFIKTGETDFSQVYEHCKEMIEQFVPRVLPSRIVRA